jgi:hypothetical protein
MQVPIGSTTKGRTLSEATAETTAPAETPATPVVEWKLEDITDDLQRMQFTMLDGFIKQRNGLVAKANAAHGDRQTLMEQIRENDTDPDIVEAREQMSAWSEKLNKLVEPKVEDFIADSAGCVAETEEEIKNIDSKLKPGLNFYKKSYDDDTAEHFTSQARLQGATVRSGGSGARRIRGFSVEITVDGEARNFDNFTQAAKHLDVDTSDLQSEFFKAAGNDDLKKIGNEVKFVINFTETDSDENSTQKEAFVKAYRDEPLTEGGETPVGSDSVEPTVSDDEDDSDADEDDENVDPFADDEDE